MNKKILSVLVLVLTFVFSTQAFASLTFTTNAITGTTASTIDLGSGNTLSLQTTGNGAIAIGTGMITTGGSITLPATTSSTTGVIYKGASPFIHNFALAGTDGNNTFVGLNAGNFTMTGSTGIQGSYNTGYGVSALNALTTGGNNSAFGFSALSALTTGGNNSAFGRASQFQINTGSNNTAVGYVTQASLTSGSNNTAIGASSQNQLSTGDSNTSVGFSAINVLTTGNNNVAIGRSAGRTSGAVPSAANSLTTGSNMTFVGYQSGLGSTTQWTNSTALGAQAYVDADNTVVLGNGSVTDVLAGSTALAKVKAGSVQYTTGSKPACDATSRGTTWYVAGGAGVKDTFEVCTKDVADAYAWRVIY